MMNSGNRSLSLALAMSNSSKVFGAESQSLGPQGPSDEEDEHHHGLGQRDDVRHHKRYAPLSLKAGKR